MRTTRSKRRISGMLQQCKAPGCLQATEGECGISRHLPLSKNIMAMAIFWQLLLKMEGSPLSEEKARDKTRQDKKHFEESMKFARRSVSDVTMISRSMKCSHRHFSSQEASALNSDSQIRLVVLVQEELHPKLC